MGNIPSSMAQDKFSDNPTSLSQKKSHSCHMSEEQRIDYELQN
jgi:hypothetical protein